MTNNTTSNGTVIHLPFTRADRSEQIPQAPDSERVILGWLLLDSDGALIGKARERLKPSQIFTQSHREIYQAILALNERNVPSDHIQVTEELRARGTLDQVGGPAYVASLIDGSVARCNFEAQIERVIETANRRKLWAVTSRAAEAVNGSTTVKEIVSGLQQVITETGQAQDKAEDWEPPTPFNEYELPSFPTEVLPSWIRSFVEQLSEALQTPDDLAALLSLAACATCVARNVEIEARPGWREPLNIYSLSVLDSANRKSKVVEEIIRPLEVFECDLLAEMKHTIAEALNEHQIIESRLEKAQKDCAKLEGEKLAKRKSEAKELAIDLNNHEVPVAPRFFVDDTTSEALASMLSEQGGRMALFSAEGGIFETIAGKYSNGAPNIDVYLKGHCGDSLRVDRRHRSERIARPAITIGLAVQSDILHGLADKPGFRGRGLLGRFLYSLPESRLGHRKSRPKPVSDEAQRTYERHLIRLAGIKSIQTADRDEPNLLRLSRDADNDLAAFQEEIEPKLAEGGEYAAFRDWAGKLAGAVVRIAGVLHLADHAAKAPAFPVEVSADMLKRALAVGRYLIPHAQAAYSEMGADPEIEAARHVLHWIGKWVESGGDRLFRKQDVWQGTKGRFKKVSALEKALGMLCEHGYVRQSVKDTSNRPGRKPGGIYEINPTITSYNSYNSYNSPEDGNSRNSRNSRTENERSFFQLSAGDEPETGDSQLGNIRSSEDLPQCSDCGTTLEFDGHCQACSDQLPF